MRVERGMDPIDTTQIPEPGLVLTTHDEATARTVMAVLEQTWATSGIAPLHDGSPEYRDSAPAYTRTSDAPPAYSQP